jgi:hypothetical protein
MRYVFGAIALFVLSGVAPAQVNFTDNFNSGASPLWGNQAGLWAASSGVYFAQQPSNSPTTYTSLPYMLTDFRADVDINGLQDGGLWLRSSITDGSRNGVLLVTGGDLGTGTGLYWHVVSNDSFSAPINRVDGLFTPGVSNAHIRVEVSGDTYSAFVNGSPTPATTLTTSEFARGEFGLYDFSNQTFDNIVLVSPVPEPSGMLAIAGVITVVAGRVRGRIKARRT